MTIAVQHEAQDRFRISVRGHELVVDQPVPTSGDAGPTPTELFVASLAACAAFYARRFLARHGLEDGELAVSCEWEWAPGYTRVSRIRLHVDVPFELSPEVEMGVLHAVDRCTVHATIRERPEVVYDVTTRARDHALTPR